VAQHIETKQERPLKSYWLKNFLPVDTTDSRLALPNDSLTYDLMNCQPVGFSNLHSIDDIGTVIHTFPAASQIYKTWSLNMHDGEYLIAAGRDGSVWAYNFTTGVTREIGPAGTTTGTDTFDVTQFDNSYALMVDTNNYWYWPDFVIIGEAGGGGTREELVGMEPVSTANGRPDGGQAIAVYQDMVWIAQGRELWYTKAGLPTDSPPSFQMFDIADGGGYSNISDSTLNSSITALVSANGFLYVFGETSIDVISDVYVPTTNGVTITPPTPTFTRLNISAIVGTDQPRSIMVYGRLVLFANKWGAWMLYGTTVQLISAPDPANNYLSSINGTWQYLTFAKSMPWPNTSPTPTGDASSTYTLKVSGGQVVTNRLLCAAFLVWRDNDPIFGSGEIILMWFSDAAGSKWWSAYYGEGITSIVTMLVDNTPAIFAIQNNALVQLFADPTSSPAARIMTALWDFGDPISDKQAIRAGVRMNMWGDPELVGAQLYIDTIRDSFLVPLGPIGIMPWKNAQGQPAAFAVDWVNPMRFLTYWAAAPNCFDKHLGFTLKTEKGTSFELNGFLLDYKIGARWAGT
jgi:hypothetical protein